MGEHSCLRTYAFLSKQRVSTPAIPNMILGGAPLLALRLSKLKRLHAPHGCPTTTGEHGSPRTYAFLINRGIMTPAILNMIFGWRSAFSAATERKRVESVFIRANPWQRFERCCAILDAGWQRGPTRLFIWRLLVAR